MTRQFHEAGSLHRRDWLKLAASGILAGSCAPWFSALAEDAATNKTRRNACILLWMTGGPSQLDTFDLKPGHANGGSFKPIATSVPGMEISEHLPRLAKQMADVAVVRSMTSKEGDHTRATYLVRTGYAPQGPVNYPALGAAVSKELGAADAELPNYVSIGPFRQFSPLAYGPGFLGPRYAPLVVGQGRRRPAAGARDGAGAGDQYLRVKNIDAPAGVTPEQVDARLSLLSDLEEGFQATRPGAIVNGHRSAYDQAVRMMRSEAVRAFQLQDEPAALREAYGQNPFGQGCLLARRLVERGVPFVEVSLNGVRGQQAAGWDTHTGNFDAVRGLSEVLDPAWGTLLEDLRERSLLKTTLVVWMGEFGRTPLINANMGRDHFPAAWSAVLCGGAIRGGQTIGKTSTDGMTVADRPVTVPDFLATIVRGLGIDPKKQNVSNVGRPIRIVEPTASPIAELLES